MWRCGGPLVSALVSGSSGPSVFVYKKVPASLILGDNPGMDHYLTHAWGSTNTPSLFMLQNPVGDKRRPDEPHGLYLDFTFYLPWRCLYFHGSD